MKSAQGSAPILVRIISAILSVSLIYFVSPHLSIDLPEYLMAILKAVVIFFLSHVPLLVFKKWVWRWHITKRLSSTPYLQGTWDGVLKSSYDKKERSIKLEIKQSFSNTWVTMNTEESKSETSYPAQILKKDSGEFMLNYTYLNTPGVDAQEESGSNKHYGTTVLALKGDNLEGRYWTDRKTHGDMNVSRKRNASLFCRGI